jgi:hypothetical protein
VQPLTTIANIIHKRPIPAPRTFNSIPRSSNSASIAKNFA